MRWGLLLFAIFGFGLNGWLYLRGGLMPGLLIAAAAALFAFLFLPKEDDSSTM